MRRERLTNERRIGWPVVALLAVMEIADVPERFLRETETRLHDLNDYGWPRYTLGFSKAIRWNTSSPSTARIRSDRRRSSSSAFSTT